MTGLRPALSVVIPTRDRPEMLRRAASHVLAALGPDDELVVVDSASADAAAVAAVIHDPRARVLRSERPGATVARNLGWQQARHDLIGFVDDDVVVDQGWADAFVACWQTHPDAAFITGRIRIPAGQGTLAVAVKDDPQPASFGRRDAGLLGHSASLAVPRDRLVEVGGFDESLGPGSRFREADDVDLFDRLLAAGGEGRYEPAADATHDQWRRIRQYVLLQHDYGYGSGARLSKLRRADPARFRVAAREDVWRWGLMLVPGELARRDWFRALGTILRVLGAIRGFAVGAVVPVRDGHFRPRRSRSTSS
jgi:glycosyltransferase involved in cell wall biosynthesis